VADRKRYAIVGTGGRCNMFIQGICKSYPEDNQLVGLCDISQVRMDYWNEIISDKYGCDKVPTFKAEQFDEMVKQTKPDVVIVTTMDCFHHQYIIRAMELGCDAVTEKPMTTDEVKAKAILETVERTGKSLRVTFNYRYQPGFEKIRELVQQGAIGQPTSVDFTWMLDTSHGADYFRRWHRELDKSGGLLVHKATHHFDLVNFWIKSYPKTVFAMGGLKFYGKENAEKRGENYQYTRYTGSPEAADDPFKLELDSQETMRRLYYEAEEETGYIRDRNVFGEPITIEDTMAVMAQYRNGVVMTYSLIAYCPYEGERIVINGTKGRLEYLSRGGSHIIAGQTDEEMAAEQSKDQGERYLRVFPMFGTPYEPEIREAAGGHGGGDAWICNQLFAKEPWDDPFKRTASHLEGAASILLGVAGEKSIRSGQPVQIDDLLKLPKDEPSSL
jgi:predicted dehydrogenase